MTELSEAHLTGGGVAAALQPPPKIRELKKRRCCRHRDQTFYVIYSTAEID